MSAGGGGSGERKDGDSRRKLYPLTHRGSYYRNVDVRFKDIVMGNQREDAPK